MSDFKAEATKRMGIFSETHTAWNVTIVGEGRELLNTLVTVENTIREKNQKAIAEQRAIALILRIAKEFSPKIEK